MTKPISRRLFLAGLPTVALAGCAFSEEPLGQNSEDNQVLTESDAPQFAGMEEPEFQQYVQDAVFASAEASITANTEDYQLQDVSVTYVSKEYLDELEFNSQSNIYFGYSLSELEQQFLGTKYIFTAEDGKTVVRAFEEPDGTFNEVVRNLAVGAGVILVCATVSVFAGGVAAAAVGNASVAATANAVNVIFAASAKTAVDCAVSSAAFGGVAAGVMTALTTGDVDETLKAIAVGGSEGFRWGAIFGAAAGGIGKANDLKSSVPSWKESEEYAQQLFGGEEQKSFLNGEEVAHATSGSTRPDLVRQLEGHLEAIEVKNYDLASSASRNELKATLRHEVTARKLHMPEGTTQRVVLDVRGRGFPNELVSTTIDELYSLLRPIDQTVIIETI